MTDAAPAPELANPVTAVLVVDDDPAEGLRAGCILEQQLGCKAHYAASGAEALEILERERLSAVLTDLVMPEMNGLELVEAIRHRHPHVPIVLLTSPGSEEIAIQALVRGAASYVPKKDVANELAETVEHILAVAQKHRQLQRLQECVTRLEYHFVLDNDRTLVPVLVGFLQEHMGNLHVCDEVARIRVGVALEEALLNAICHGNLGVGSELRQNGDDAFYREVELRRRQAPYRERRVHLDASLSRTEAVFVVRDEGPGFRPAHLPDPTDPANLDRISGRGLLLIHTFMDEVRHNETGNQITMIKRRTAGEKKG